MQNDEELNLDNLETQPEEKLKVKNRFDKLSEKVILTSKEKEELARLNETLKSEKDSLAKERDFYKDFSSNVSKYPNASEYQDKILEKVKGGYTTEDAMVAVLAKEGKLNISSQQVQPQMGQVEGGSAPTSFEGTKSIYDMTADEKLSALKDAEKDGSLVSALRGGR